MIVVKYYISLYKALVIIYNNIYSYKPIDVESQNIDSQSKSAKSESHILNMAKKIKCNQRISVSGANMH